MKLAPVRANRRSEATFAGLVLALACGDVRDEPQASSTDGTDPTTPGTTMPMADGTTDGPTVDDTGGKLDVGIGTDLGGGNMAVTCADVERLSTNQGCEF